MHAIFRTIKKVEKNECAWVRVVYPDVQLNEENINRSCIRKCPVASAAELS